MFFKKSFFIIFLSLCLTKGAFSETIKIGSVNFSKCIVESEYGKREQAQMQNIKDQWNKLRKMRMMDYYNDKHKFKKKYKK